MKLASVALPVLVLAAWLSAPALSQRPPGVGPPGTARCGIAGTTHVSFGDYHPLSPLPLDTMGSVTLRCTGGGMVPPIVVQLGRSRGGGFLPRAMLSGSHRLDYNLYLDAGRTVVWGDGTSGTATFTAQPARGRPVVVPIFARVPARQRVQVGRYSDSIVMTLLY